MQPDQVTTRQVLGLVVAMLIAGVATLAARRLHWPDMLVALGLGLLLAPTLGWTTVFTVLAAILCVFAAAWALARLLRVPAEFAAIAATSVAICGVSAALAAASALPQRPQLHDATLFVCVAVSLSPEHGELATLTKLLRVSLLAPVVVVLRGWSPWWRRSASVRKRPGFRSLRADLATQPRSIRSRSRRRRSAGSRPALARCRPRWLAAC